MLGLNPGRVTRQIHDDIMTRWIYETTDNVEEIIYSDNYLVYLNHSPEKIHPGDEIIIRSKTVDNEFNLLTCIVGYNIEEESFFPIFTQCINIYTGEVTQFDSSDDSDDIEGSDNAN